MGNWRTVRVVGTCPAEQVEALGEAIRDDFADETWGPLTNTSGLAGLGSWPAAEMDRVGNLAERDYGPDDVAAHLKRLAVAAPGLKLKIHCGGEYEDKRCIATLTLMDGSVVEGPAEIESIGEIPESQLLGNLASQLGAYGRR